MPGNAPVDDHAVERQTMRLSVLTIAMVAASTTAASAGDFLFFKSKDRGPRRSDVTLVSQQPSLYVPPPAPAVDDDGSAPLLLPVPTAPSPGHPVPHAGPGGLTTMPLFHRVEYDDVDEMHPCAVPIVVAVPDPCAEPCECAGPQCVYVKICVPPNCEPRIKYSRGGREIKYDFGDDYEVKITSKKGRVEVEYDD
jgi:hypothetical protein